MRHSWEQDGSPSSLDVLIEWLVTPGNFERYIERKQLLLELVDEIYTLLERRGIHRSRKSIERKLGTVVAQFGKASSWRRRVESRGQRVDEAVQEELQRLCPGYFELEPVLDSAPTLVPKRFRPRQSGETIKSKRSRPSQPRENIKQERVHGMETRSTATKKHPSRSNHVGGTKPSELERSALLNATPQECRELFRLELQVQRDRATCVRVKARKELLGLGIPRKKVDRLLPL